MTVIKCALCGDPVDEGAGVCPKCGWPVLWGRTEPRKSRKTTTAPPPVTRRPVAPSATERKLPSTSTRSWWLPIGTIVVAVFAWAAYTLFTPSAPPLNDGDAGTRSGEPPEGTPAAGATPGDGSALPQEPNPDESGEANPEPQNHPPSVESRDTTTSSENATSPAEAPLSSAWRTADGKLYFGNAPPPGSVKLESFGKPASPKNTPRPSSP